MLTATKKSNKRPDLEIAFEITGIETTKPKVQVRVLPLSGMVLIRKHKELIKLLLRDFNKELETV